MGYGGQTTRSFRGPQASTRPLKRGGRMPASTPSQARDAEGSVRAVIARLARPDGEGGVVIERAAIIAEGEPAGAIEAWIVAHGGEPEVPADPYIAAWPPRSHGRNSRRPATAPLCTSRHRAGVGLMKEVTNKQPLRGEAAYRAERAEIAKRNDAACAAGAQRRASKEAEAAQEFARQARREAQAARSSAPSENPGSSRSASGRRSDAPARSWRRSPPAVRRSAPRRSDAACGRRPRTSRSDCSASPRARPGRDASG